MRPVVTPTDMALVDARHAERLDELIDLAGRAVAREAIAMLGGTYGRRVIVVAGKGNNGADGQVAASVLRQRGVRVTVIEASDPVVEPLDADLLIDAAYGCGLSRPYTGPMVSERTPVLAVDLPSGVDGQTGERLGSPLRADRTVTFAALKPGLLFEPGRSLCGQIKLAPLDDVLSQDAAAMATTHAVTADDVAAWWPRRDRGAHKWASATWVIGGSPGMVGAPVLAARGAQRSGSGYVRLSVPGADVAQVVGPIEAVVHALSTAEWAADVVRDAKRFGALAVGPGLGRTEAAAAALTQILAETTLPVVLDADALHALAAQPGQLRPGVILTPHDREFEVLAGVRPGPDRIESTKRLAAERGAVVLLKGPTTVVADPDGQALVVTSGDERLATAGSGDVLTGVIAALLAQGTQPLRAAAAGAFIHGAAAMALPRVGMVAGDIPDAIPAAVADLRLAEQPSTSSPTDRA